MRGEAGVFPLDAATVRAAGRSLARHLSAKEGRAARIVTGRDTRESGGWIEEAFVEGAGAAGAECESAGVITTPGVAFLARALPADAGVVISASHNPFHDNGIKIFSPTGRKLDDATERLIEADIHAGRAEGAAEVVDEGSAQGQGDGRARDEARAESLRARYLDYLAAEVAAGLRLEGRRVVAPVMSNLGREVALRGLGVELLRTDVGDKYVLEELLRTGAGVGGEQSGHIIFPAVSLAGDGLVTALRLLRVMRETGRPLHELTEGFERYPQVLTNVRVREKRPFEEVEEVARCARETEAALGERGRLLLRYSGTEPLARVMIEGQRQDEIERLAEGLAAVIRRSLGAA